MFSDLKKGFQVHTLDTNTVPKYELGKVVAVSEPRYLPPQPGQYQAMQTRVVEAEAEAVVLMGRTWSTDMGSFLLMIITVCMRR